MRLEELKNKHKDADIYVVGSGASLDYIDPDFFSEKIVVCINHTYRHVSTENLYVVSKEPNETMQQDVHAMNGTLVTCKHHSGYLPQENPILYPEITAIFKPEKDSIKDKEQVDGLTVSASTITTGIHLAAFMGAKWIFLVGHDCGSLDGQTHVTGYNKDGAVTPEHAYPEWMKMNSVEERTLYVKSVLKNVWKCGLHSISPFVNFELEDHKYEKF